MKFAGIDYDSAAIHVVTIHEDDGRLLEHRAFDLAAGPGDAFDRARRVRDLLPARTAWRDAGILAIGLELPFTRQLNSLVAQIRVQGAILACLPRELVVLDLRPQRWKLAALGPGHGNATKEQVRAWALEQGFPEHLDQDYVDAYAIARATRVEWTRNPPREERSRAA